MRERKSKTNKTRDRPGAKRRERAREKKRRRRKKRGSSSTKIRRWAQEAVNQSDSCRARTATGFVRDDLISPLALSLSLSRSRELLCTFLAVPNDSSNG